MSRSSFAFALLLAGVALGGCLPPMGTGGGGGGGGAPYSGGGGGGGGGGPDPAVNQSSGGGGGGGGGPQTVSVTIRSSCAQTVKVFYGDKPKYGSGTNSSISSNSVQSHTFQVGDSFWIIDDSENGLSQYTIEPNTSTIEIASSCSSFR